MTVLPPMMSDDNSCKAAVRCGEIRDQAEEDAKFGMAGRWGEFIRRRCTCRYSRSSLSTVAESTDIANVTYLRTVVVSLSLFDLARIYLLVLD